MPKRTSLVSKAYRAREFIPEDFVDVLGALAIVVGPVDDNLTEVEFRQRRDQAIHWIKQACYAGKLSAEIITASGHRSPIRKNVWGGAATRRIFDLGTTSVATGNVYFPDTTAGHVLFPEAKLRRALDATTSVREEPESPSSSQAEIAKIRNRLKNFIEATAKISDSEGYKKADFLAAARAELGKNISESMFKEVWRDSALPEQFKTHGRRPGASNK